LDHLDYYIIKKLKLVILKLNIHNDFKQYLHKWLQFIEVRTIHVFNVRHIFEQVTF